MSENVVALVGAPNSGKTTLYNWLTKSQYKTVNYPGSTVDYAVGTLAGDSEIQIIDTPGTYSLFPKSQDEQVTHDVLFAGTLGVRRVILVCDGTQIERHLLIGYQLQQAGISFVVAVTMNDLLVKNKIPLNLNFIRKEFDFSFVLFDGVNGAGLDALITEVKKLPPRVPGQLDPWSAKKFEQTSDLIEKKINISRPAGKQNQLLARTQGIDRWLLHPVFGVAFFFIIMSVIFASIFWVSAPVMDAVDQFFAWTARAILSVNPQSLWVQFLSDGLVVSIGAVLVFVPQIFILFLGIGFLESSGYLSRASTIVDRPLLALGLSGRSFVPLLSGFACAVPAMMASRNLSSKKERWIVNFIIPLMTCSARIPVFALLIGLLFYRQSSWWAGLAMAAMYFLSLAVGMTASFLLSKIIRTKEKSLFLMELPLYRWPRWRVLVKQSILRTQGYIRRAGPMIFLFAVILWIGAHFPIEKEIQDPQIWKTASLDQSYLGQLGKNMEPLFEPLGTDWRVGIGLISAFAAREVFVSSLALVFNIPQDGKPDSEKGLLKTLSQATNEKGQALFKFSSVVGLLIFFMIALQCMSTFIVSIKENHSLKFALGQLVGLNLLAYIVSVSVVQFLQMFQI